MEMDLAPHTADTTVFDGEAGAYYAWTSAVSPTLAVGKVGAGKLVLRRGGLALPHYADSAKIGYVIQGMCTVGLIAPNDPQEKLLTITKDDAVVVPLGAISWWYNNENTEVVIIFLGGTSLSYNPGEFSYFFPVGAIGIFSGFSSDFISKIYDINEQESRKLTKSQPNPLLVKVDHELILDPNQFNRDKDRYVMNLNGMFSEEITVDNLPLLEKVGLSASLVRLEPDAAFGPSYSTDGTYRVVYVVKGSGRVQIIGLGGNQMLDTEVQHDQVFVVPKFFAMALIGGDQGIEFLTVTTSSRPMIGQLTGNLSPLKALPSSVLQAALNVDSEFVKYLESKI